MSDVRRFTSLQRVQLRVFVPTDQFRLQFIIDFSANFISVSTTDSSCGVLNTLVSCGHLKCSCSVCGMVKIMKDVEIAQHIDQCDSDLPISNTYWKVTVPCLNKHPRLMCDIVLSCDSDELECCIISGGEGSDWQKVADSNDI